MPDLSHAAGMDIFTTSPGIPEKSTSVGLFAVTLVELFDTPCGINKLLFAGEERVALRADTDFVFGAGGFDFPNFAAGANDLRGTVIRMDILFHCFSPKFFIVEKLFLQYNLASVKYTPQMPFLQV